MEMTIFSADALGDARNCMYPHEVRVADEAALEEAVSRDYVCAAYEGGRRSADAFLWSDVVAVDCDNDHSDQPDDWVTPEDIESAFPDVSFAVHYSRSDGVEKDGHAARPKFHVLFPVPKVEDADAYAALKRMANAVFPYFDANAMDAARFFFGTGSPRVEMHEGWLTLADYLDLDDDEFDARMGQGGSPVIEEGSRNATMSRFAARVLKRYGDTEEAHAAFLEQAERCSPPLPDAELASIWRSARKFYAGKVAKDPGYVPPDEYNAEYSLMPDDFTDIGQAYVLAREYEDVLCYTDATGYLRYTGINWQESKQLAVGAAEEFLDRQLEQAEAAVERAIGMLVKAGIPRGIAAAGPKAAERECRTQAQLSALFELRKADAYERFAIKRRDMKYVMSALQAAKPMLYRDIREFDACEFDLNCPDGTYDLRLGMDGRRGHAAGDLVTKVCAASPSDAGRGVWEAALSQFFCGDDDLVGYVQMNVGLAAIGHVYQEALIIAYGEGSNGKSTFWNVIARVLGSYAGTLSADALTIGCKRNVKPEKAEIKGKRLIIAAELEEGMRLNTSMVKQLCSTDEITAEKKYKDPFNYVPTHTLVLYTNHLPKVGAADSGTWRRLIVIPFNAKITGSGDVKNYANRLFDEAAGAIMAWIVEGAQRAIARGFHLEPPDAVRQAIQRYREGNDWLGMFLEECCEQEASYTAKSGELYQEYRAFCARTGEFTRSTAEFYAAIEQAGFRRHKLKAGTLVYGLRVREEFPVQ